jgi:hypothetical protein
MRKSESNKHVSRCVYFRLATFEPEEPTKPTYVVGRGHESRADPLARGVGVGLLVLSKHRARDELAAREAGHGSRVEMGKHTERRIVDGANVVDQEVDLQVDWPAAVAARDMVRAAVWEASTEGETRTPPSHKADA